MLVDLPDKYSPRRTYSYNLSPIINLQNVIKESKWFHWMELFKSFLALFICLPGFSILMLSSNHISTLVDKQIQKVGHLILSHVVWFYVLYNLQKEIRGERIDLWNIMPY